jgi:hypothetical protein
MSPRPSWNNANTWLVNAESEHEREPFYAILALSNPRNRSYVMRADDIISGTATMWLAPNSAPVDRNAEAMAGCVAPMLRCATKILFIDPYFRASRPEFNNSLAAFLRKLSSRGFQIAVELHTTDRDDAPPFPMFKKECESYLPKSIPTGITLVVRRWKRRDAARERTTAIFFPMLAGLHSDWALVRENRVQTKTFRD